MKKKMNKVLVVCTAAAAMTAFSGTAFGATLDLESKTAVADAKDGSRGYPGGHKSDLGERK